MAAWWSTLPHNYYKHQQPPPDCQFSLECLDTDFLLNILNSLEDTNPTTYDKDDSDNLGDFTLLDEGEIEAVKDFQITLLQTAETGDGGGSSGEDQIFLIKIDV